MGRWTWSLLLVAGALLIAGVVHVTSAILENLRHPEWSAPAYVNVIYGLPYLLAAGILALLYRRLARR